MIYKLLVNRSQFYLNKWQVFKVSLLKFWYFWLLPRCRRRPKMSLIKDKHRDLFYFRRGERMLDHDLSVERMVSNMLSFEAFYKSQNPTTRMLLAFDIDRVIRSDTSCTQSSSDSFEFG